QVDRLGEVGHTGAGGSRGDVGGAHLDRERALAGCGGDDVDVEQLADHVGAAQPREPCVGEDDGVEVGVGAQRPVEAGADVAADVDRKSTRLNSSHVKISYAVFCLKKK